ncbi:MAG: hypothetical protein QW115_01745 [Thermoplasmata archaeon]
MPIQCRNMSRTSLKNILKIECQKVLSALHLIIIFDSTGHSTIQYGCWRVSRNALGDGGYAARYLVRAIRNLGARAFIKVKSNYSAKKKGERDWPLLVNFQRQNRRASKKETQSEHRIGGQDSPVELLSNRAR